jgi:hypothetical protein
MKKLLPLLLFLSLNFLNEALQAQKTFFSLGPELSIPKSFGLKMVSGTAIGGSFRLESSLSDHVSGMASIGYLASSEQHPYPSTPTTTSLYKLIPFQAGIKYYLRQRDRTPMGFYFSGELGILRTNVHFTYAVNPENTRKETDLGLAFGLGYLIRKLDAGFRLQYDLSDAGFNIYQFNFRLAYVFRKK